MSQIPRYLPAAFMTATWYPTDSKGRPLRFSNPRSKGPKLDVPTRRALKRIKSALPCRINPTGSPTQKQGAYELMLSRDAAVAVRG